MADHPKHSFIRRRETAKGTEFANFTGTVSTRLKNPDCKYGTRSRTSAKNHKAPLVRVALGDSAQSLASRINVPNNLRRRGFSCCSAWLPKWVRSLAAALAGLLLFLGWPESLPEPLNHWQPSKCNRRAVWSNPCFQALGLLPANRINKIWKLKPTLTSKNRRSSLADRAVMCASTPHNYPPDGRTALPAWLPSPLIYAVLQLEKPSHPRRIHVV